MKKLSEGIFSANQLKILAAISMTADHIGVEIFYNVDWLRIVGRLAFPIFAYMIAEGARYTKNRRRYLLTISLIAFLCQLVYYFAMSSLMQCVLVTFALSLVTIFSVDKAVRDKDIKSCLLMALTFFGVYFVTECLPSVLSNTDFYIDYGFWGVMLPVLVYAGKTKKQKLLFLTAGLIMLSISLNGVQWFSLLSILPLALYNGKKGKYNIKNFFYIYYPLHLVIIYLIGCII